MTSDFEVQLSPEYLAKIEMDLDTRMKALGSSTAFTAYNRGGGPKGDYDRHYDKSTGLVALGVADNAET